LALLLVAFILAVAFSVWLAEVIANVSGIRSDEIRAWELGVLTAGGLAWTAYRLPLMRFSLMVTVVAVLMIVLILHLTDGNEEILDTFLVKALVTVVSVGTGAVYLFWEAGRGNL